MKPEVTPEEVTLAQLNMMALVYGREAVESSVDKAIAYSDAHASDHNVVVGAQFITIVPKGVTTAEISRKAVFSVHVPSGAVFIDEKGHFGEVRTAAQAYAEFLELHKRYGGEAFYEPSPGQSNVLPIVHKRGKNSIH